MNNLQRYEADLQSLIQRGESLEVAIVHECSLEEAKGVGVEEILERAERMGLCDGDDQVHIPSFTREYQEWYSDAEVVVRQLLSRRLEDFCAYYQEPESQSRKKITNDDYRISDYLAGRQRMVDAVYGRPIHVRGNPIVFILFGQQLAIVKAAGRKLTSSLHDIKQFVQADLFDSELEAAKALVDNGFSRAAGVIAGVVMERHLAQVCESHSIKFQKKKLTFNDFNNGLKDNNVIDTAQWRFNQRLGDLRNSCAHHNDKKEVSKEQVEELIDGVARIIKTLS